MASAFGGREELLPLRRTDRYDGSAGNPKMIFKEFSQINEFEGADT